MSSFEFSDTTSIEPCYALCGASANGATVLNVQLGQQPTQHSHADHDQYRAP